jgi:putative addiction module CopG family antidote
MPRRQPGKVTSMSISLPADLARLVRDAAESGRCSSASEVIGDGLRLLQSSESGGSRGSENYDRARVRDALEGLRKLAAKTLGQDHTTPDLIDEGRL